MEEQLKMAVEFFKSNKRYHRILEELAKNYRSRGVIGGTIFLKDLNFDEKMVLCKIDSKFIDSKDARFSVIKFIKTFDDTSIAGIDFHGILEAYFDKEILTKKSVKEDEDVKKEQYFTEITSRFEGTLGGKWLTEILESKEYGYSIVIREFNSNPKALKKLLVNVIKGVNLVKGKKREYVRLAIFASQVTTNPHYFDGKNIGGKLLVNALAYIAKIRLPENSEAESELLFQFGIIKDEISNYTTCVNILGFSKEGEHEGIRGFSSRGEPIQLSLFNLSLLDYFTCTDNVLYVFENPTVFSEVLTNTRDLNVSLLCTSGQLKLASLVLLDKLASGVDRIYYSGDFDPEGVNIANRLKQRYGNKLTLWKYDIETYERIISHVDFNGKRLKQLDKITYIGLQSLANEMRRVKKCAYQELLVSEYIAEIRSKTLG